MCIEANGQYEWLNVWNMAEKCTVQLNMVNKCTIAVTALPCQLKHLKVMHSQCYGKMSAV